MHQLKLTLSLLLCCILFNISSADPAVAPDSDPLNINRYWPTSVLYQYLKYPVKIANPGFHQKPVWRIKSEDGIASMEASCNLDFEGGASVPINMSIAYAADNVKTYPGGKDVPPNRDLIVQTVCKTEETIDVQDGTLGNITFTLNVEYQSGKKPKYSFLCDIIAKDKKIKMKKNE